MDRINWTIPYGPPKIRRRVQAERTNDRFRFRGKPEHCAMGSLPPKRKRKLNLRIQVSMPGHLVDGHWKQPNMNQLGAMLKRNEATQDIETCVPAQLVANHDFISDARFPPASVATA